MSYCMYTTQGDITCNKSSTNQDLLAHFPSVPPVHRVLNSDPNPYPLTHVPNLNVFKPDSLARIPNTLANVSSVTSVPPITPVPNVHSVPPVIPVPHTPPVPNVPLIPNVPNLNAIPDSLARTLNSIPDPFVRASDLFVRNPNPNPNSDYKNTRKGTCENIDIDISNNNIENFNWSYL